MMGYPGSDYLEPHITRSERKRITEQKRMKRRWFRIRNSKSYREDNNWVFIFFIVIVLLIILLLLLYRILRYFNII